MSRSHDNTLQIRAMRPDEVLMAVDWAAAEGWNPGLADAECFARAAPGVLLQPLVVRDVLERRHDVIAGEPAQPPDAEPRDGVLIVVRQLE